MIPKQSPREELEVRVTALLMGELPPEEAQLLEAQIATDAELKKLHERLREAVGLLREASAIPEQAVLPVPVQFSEERRQRLLAHFKVVTSMPGAAVAVKRKRDWKWMVPLGLAASLIALLGGAVMVRMGGRWLGPGNLATVEMRDGEVSDLTSDADGLVFNGAPPSSPVAQAFGRRSDEKTANQSHWFFKTPSDTRDQLAANGPAERAPALLFPEAEGRKAGEAKPAQSLGRELAENEVTRSLAWSGQVAPATGLAQLSDPAANAASRELARNRQPVSAPPPMPPALTPPAAATPAPAAPARQIADSAPNQVLAQIRETAPMPLNAPEAAFAVVPEAKLPALGTQLASKPAADGAMAGVPDGTTRAYRNKEKNVADLDRLAEAPGKPETKSKTRLSLASAASPNAKVNDPVAGKPVTGPSGGMAGFGGGVPAGAAPASGFAPAPASTLAPVELFAKSETLAKGKAVRGLDAGVSLGEAPVNPVLGDLNGGMSKQLDDVSGLAARPTLQPGTKPESEARAKGMAGGLGGIAAGTTPLKRGTAGAGSGGNKPAAAGGFVDRGAVVENKNGIIEMYGDANVPQDAKDFGIANAPVVSSGGTFGFGEKGLNADGGLVGNLRGDATAPTTLSGGMIAPTGGGGGAADKKKYAYSVQHADAGNVAEVLKQMGGNQSAAESDKLARRAPAEEGEIKEMVQGDAEHAHVAGNARTKDKVIRREVLVPPGAPGAEPAAKASVAEDAKMAVDAPTRENGDKLAKSSAPAQMQGRMGGTARAAVGRSALGVPAAPKAPVASDSEKTNNGLALNQGVPKEVEFEGFINYGSPVQSTEKNELGQTITINPPPMTRYKVKVEKPEMFGVDPSGGAASEAEPAAQPPLTAPMPVDNYYSFGNGDLFKMPTVDSYAVSEPFSTAGKVDMQQKVEAFAKDTSMGTRGRGTSASGSQDATTENMKRLKELKFYSKTDGTPTVATGVESDRMRRKMAPGSAPQPANSESEVKLVDAGEVAGEKTKGKPADVKQKLVDADQLFQTGRYDLALKRADEALAADPYNIGARKMQEKIHEEQDHAANLSYQETRSRMLWKVDRGWSSPNDKSAGALAATGKPAAAAKPEEAAAKDRFGDTPVKWLYILNDGTIGPASNATASNPVVGRTSFWNDDDSVKLNIDTATEGTFWDEPAKKEGKEVADGVNGAAHDYVELNKPSLRSGVVDGFDAIRPPQPKSAEKKAKGTEEVKTMNRQPHRPALSVEAKQQLAQANDEKAAAVTKLAVEDDRESLVESTQSSLAKAHVELAENEQVQKTLTDRMQKLGEEIKDPSLAAKDREQKTKERDDLVASIKEGEHKSAMLRQQAKSEEGGLQAGLEHLMRYSTDPAQTAQVLIKVFPSLPPEGQASVAQHLSKLVSEQKYAIVLPEEIRKKVKELRDEDEARVVHKPAPADVPQPEIATRENAFSTFSLNVSDVAFKLAGASLEQGKMPEVSSMRSEEFINAFDYRDPEPAAGVPLAFATERARYPFAQNRDLLRFAVKTAAAGRQPGKPLNVVLLLDNSGSMERADRVHIVHEALRVLAGQLQAQDQLSIVTFARTPRLWIDGVAGDKAGEAVERVAEITPQGGTNIDAALDLGYATALRHYQAGSVNRVVLLTDGAANLGDVDPDALKKKVEAHRKQGVALDCFGIGWEGYDDTVLEALSRNGDGRYGFINTPEEAATEFAGQLAGALHVAAADVKVQVEFNPRRVTAYRQIGYAKHQLTKEQFRDNTVDAAEIGAAESGNALYVVEVNPRGEGDLATVHVRFKDPGTSEYKEHEWAVPFTANAPALEQASPALRLAGTASAFAEWLAGSPYAAEVTPDRLLGLINGVPGVYGADPRPQRLEWMIRQAKNVSGK